MPTLRAFTNFRHCSQKYWFFPHMYSSDWYMADKAFSKLVSPATDTVMSRNSSCRSLILLHEQHCVWLTMLPLTKKEKQQIKLKSLIAQPRVMWTLTLARKVIHWRSTLWETILTRDSKISMSKKRKMPAERRSNSKPLDCTRLRLLTWTDLEWVFVRMCR